MRNLLVILFALFVLSLILISLAPKNEGFASEGEPNYALNLVAQLKRTTQALANPTLWRDRISMMGKSPIDLARAYALSQKARV